MKRERTVTPLGGKTWAVLLAFGLIGQIAWVVENMYFNVFLYNTVSGDTRMIAAMVAASAVVAAVTTLFVGALSDKLGRRKAIIVYGYLLWGLSVMVFALVRVDWMAHLVGPASAAYVTAVLVVVLDCVMTFFGSSANDAAFNAWVTDATDETNRGRVESVLAVMPLIAMLVVFGALDALTTAGRWWLFFLIVGALVMLGGALGHFLIEEKAAPPTEGTKGCFANIVYGLRPSVVLANPVLYLALLSLGIYNASQQVYMPYLIIYLQRGLGIDDYAVVLGAVLLAASLISVLFGRLIDRRGKVSVAIPAAVVAILGLTLMVFARSAAAVILSGIVMLGGSMVLSACFQGLVRDYTPAGKAGQFQGIRILFQVLLPMVTGPYIGSAVIRSTGRTYEELGVIREVPTADIFTASAVVLFLIFIPILLLKRREKAPAALKTLYTPWGAALDKGHPLPEYPRPQLCRDSYQNLNGPWGYAFTDGRVPERFEHDITVPFSPECPLSGVSRQLKPGETLWYRRGFRLSEGFHRGRALLHFGAVDQCCTVYLNGQEVGSHAGGYLPFSFDVTDFLCEGENTLVLSVTDATEQRIHAYGKQSSRRGGIWYTPQSGIWQTVWLESVPVTYIQSLKITPLYDDTKVRLELTLSGAAEAKVDVMAAGRRVASGVFQEGVCTISIPDVHPWSPEDPFLYDLRVTAGEDLVTSYFAMRKFGTTVLGGKPVCTLNNRPFFMTGVLDQGYWSDGFYTPPSDEAMVYDIQTMKDYGFNTLRKHIKIEPLRWYYHCDRLGMVVWQDLVSGGGAFRPMTMQVLPFLGIHLKDTKGYHRFAREDEAGRDQFVEDLYGTVDLLYNSPCVGVWVPFNEGWGQFDSLQLTQTLWEIDPTRLVDHASGWHDQGGGDFKSRHVYFRRVKLRGDRSRVLVLTEFGGYSCPVAEHMVSKKPFGYRVYETPEELTKAWCRLYEKEVLPCMEKQKLCAAIYTQLSDVEDEINGLLTYDRRVKKLPAEAVRAINERLKRFVGG